MAIAFDDAKRFLKRTASEHERGTSRSLDSLETYLRHAAVDDVDRLNTLLADARGTGRLTVLNLINEITRKKLVRLLAPMEWDMQALLPGQAEPAEGRSWALKGHVEAYDADDFKDDPVVSPGTDPATLSPATRAPGL
jgi:hypothetical protein